MAQIVFSRAAAVEVVHNMTVLDTVLETENYNLQSNYEALCEAVRDPFIYEYKVEFEKGNAAIRKVRESIADLSISMFNYAEKLYEEMNRK